MGIAPNREDLLKLQTPFAAEDVEWRLQSAGEKRDGGFWGKALAYITNRAIMERLDEVCGPENWKNEFKEGPGGGIIAGISIRVRRDDLAVTSPTEWVTKWDGADNTQVEAVKGGLSGAMKRAGVQWGIGRYLYNLDEGWVEIAEDRAPGAKQGKAKGGGEFWWYPPALPKWALPRDHRAKAEFIANNLGTLTDDTVGVIEGEPVKLKKFIEKNKEQLRENYRLVSQIVTAIERALGVTYRPA